MGQVLEQVENDVGVLLHR